MRIKALESVFSVEMIMVAVIVLLVAMALHMNDYSLFHKVKVLLVSSIVVLGALGIVGVIIDLKKRD